MHVGASLPACILFGNKHWCVFLYSFSWAKFFWNDNSRQPIIESISSLGSAPQRGTPSFAEVFCQMEHVKQFHSQDVHRKLAWTCWAGNGNSTDAVVHNAIPPACWWEEFRNPESSKKEFIAVSASINILSIYLLTRIGKYPVKTSPLFGKYRNN